jgi:hypothetical protein
VEVGLVFVEPALESLDALLDLGSGGLEPVQLRPGLGNGVVKCLPAALFGL